MLIYTKARIIDVNQQTVIESNIAMGDGIVSGYLETALNAGDYTVEIDIWQQNQLLTKTQRRIKVKDLQSVDLAVTSIEPVNGGENIEPNASISLAFNKPIDVSKLAVIVTETAHGFSYVNADPLGVSTLEAKGYQLTRVDLDDAPVTGELSILPGNKMVAFYPSREFAYGSQVSVEVIYDAQSMLRQRFETRALPTFIEGAVKDQFGQMVSGVEVSIPELGRRTLTNNLGSFSFGYGDTAKNILPDGRYTLVINEGIQLQGYGRVQKKIFINRGEKTSLGAIALSQLNKNDQFSVLEAGRPVTLAKGDLILDLQDANIYFPNNDEKGFAMAVFTEQSAFSHNVAPLFNVFWLYQLHPMGVEVRGEVKVDFALPFNRELQTHIWQDDALLLLVGLNPKTDMVEPVGVARVASNRAVSVKSEYQRLDAIGYALVPDTALPAMQKYIAGEINLAQMIAQIQQSYSITAPAAQTTN